MPKKSAGMCAPAESDDEILNQKRVLIMVASVSFMVRSSKEGDFKAIPEWS